MKKFLKVLLIILIFLAIVGAIAFAGLRFMQNSGIIGKYKKTNLLINNNNVTGSLKHEMIIEEDVIFLSRQDVRNFFDTDLYFNGTDKRVITTHDTKVANLIVGQDTIDVNGKTVTLKAHMFQENETTYIPVSELKDIYDIEIKYDEETNIIIIDSLYKEQVKAKVKKNDNVQTSTNIIGKFIDKVKKDEEVIVVSSTNGWSKVRTERGFVGYIKDSSLTDYVTVRKAKEEKSLFSEKVNMFWDYFSVSGSVPDRTGEKYVGVNVVSPTFFEIKKQGEGEIIDKADNGGTKYVSWAHGNNYQVWALLSNESLKESTSVILNSYNNRNKLINNILNLVDKYNLDGINIDFESIYKDDKDMFSQFIIELYPRLKEKKVVLSIDVTAPDGADDWSKCYDRLVLGRNSDYIIFMAYDQFGQNSDKAGTTAGYNWIVNGLNKFLKEDSVNYVPAEKLILAIPFYTRVWTEDSSGKLIKTAVTSMKLQKNNVPGSTEVKWLDDVKQYYAEWKDGSNTKKMWLEEENSIKAKISIATENNLAGVSFWVKDREVNTIWKVIDEELNK